MVFSGARVGVMPSTESQGLYEWGPVSCELIVQLQTHTIFPRFHFLPIVLVHCIIFIGLFIY